MASEYPLSVRRTLDLKSLGPAERQATERTRVWAMTGVSLLVVAMWMLLRPYRSIEHDSIIYTFFALAHLHPESLGHDFFARFGNQDHYTVFSPLYAAAIKAFGLEHAAAVLTFVTQLGFYVCAFRLARRAMPAREALLAVGLLAVIPAYYGGGKVFSHTEPFCTPRQPAEVFALAGIISELGGRRLIAVACLIASALLHPIIAAAAFALCAVLIFAEPRPWLALGVVAGGLALFALLSATIAAGPFAHFDDHWWSLVHGRLHYLFPLLWPSTDWDTDAVGLLTLLMAALSCRERAVRVLSVAVATTSAFGLLLAVLGADLLRVVTIAEMQTWRWLWLSGVVSVLLLPLIVAENWTRGRVGRAAVVLLAAAWLPLPDAVCWLPALGACACAWAARRAHPPSRQRLVFFGACSVAAACLVLFLNDYGDLALRLDFARRIGSHYFARIGELRVLGYDGVMPAAILTLTWWTARRATQRTAVLLATLGSTACLAILPYSWAAWTQIRYPKPHIAEFAPWRKVIPPATEVLWPGSPEDDWFLLGRPSYWSLTQMAGMVFSRDDAMIGARREDALGTLPGALGLFATPFAPARSARVAQRQSKLRTALCSAPGLEFFASWTYLGPTPYPAVMRTVGLAHRPMYLYRCAHADH